MSTQSVLQSLKESILSQASVKAIYGEPISAHGKTVIPGRKNNVCLWSRGGHWRCGRYECPGAKEGVAVEEYGLCPWEL
jgi:uncharacterized spore protein YtfJ